MRYNAQRYPDKKLGRAAEETRLIMYLCNVRPHLRPGITLDTLRQGYPSLPPKFVEYRLMLAQQSWAKDTTQGAGQ